MAYNTKEDMKALFVKSEEDGKLQFNDGIQGFEVAIVLPDNHHFSACKMNGTRKDKKELVQTLFDTVCHAYNL
jgi:hypothetical protein